MHLIVHGLSVYFLVYKSYWPWDSELTRHVATIGRHLSFANKKKIPNLLSSCENSINIYIRSYLFLQVNLLSQIESILGPKMTHLVFDPVLNCSVSWAIKKVAAFHLSGWLLSCRLDSDMPPLGLLIDDTGPKKQLLWPFTCSPQQWSAYRHLSGHEGYGSIFEKRPRRICHMDQCWMPVWRWCGAIRVLHNESKLRNTDTPG